MIAALLNFKWIAIIAVIVGLFGYHKYLTSKIETLEETNTSLSTVVDSQKTTILDMKSNLDDIVISLAKFQKDIDLSKKKHDSYLKLFNKEDLKKKSLENTSNTEKVLNEDINSVFNDINKLSN